MITHTTTMLYVSDVENATDFWQQAFQITHLETIQLPEEFLSVKLYLQNSFSIQLFDKEFIRRFSPEVAINSPSLLFSTNEIEALHKQLSNISPFVSEISDQAGNKHFNFSDNDEHFFAVIEEKKDEDY